MIRAWPRLTAPRAALAALVLAISLLATGPAASAQTNRGIESFEAIPGLIRTNIDASELDSDPNSGLLYATVRDGDRTNLTVIDPVALSVVDAVALDVSFDAIRDLDVSRDHRTILVLTERSVYQFERDGLALEARYDVNDGRDLRYIRAAPDRPERFLAWEDFSSAVWLFDGDDGNLLQADQNPVGGGVAITARNPAVFGSTSDEVFDADPGAVRRWDVAATPVVVATSEQFTPGPSFRFNVSFEAGQVLLGEIVVDPVTLREVDRLAIRPQTFGDLFGDNDDGWVLFQDTNSDVWQLFDTVSPIEPPRFWSLPIEDGGDAVTLPDGRVVTIEAEVEEESGFVSIVDTELMASAFGEYHPITPTRLLDTRSGNGAPQGPIGPDETVTVEIGGRSGIPSTGVLAIALNLTVTRPTAASYFSVGPADGPASAVSNLNFGLGQTIANFVTVSVNESGEIDLLNKFGNAHAIIDVLGYYVDDTGQPGTRYEAQSSGRIEDTRFHPAPVGPGETIDVFVNLADQYDAVAINLTVVGPTSPGYLIVWPTGLPRPTASTINFEPGNVRANMTVVPVGTDGRISIYNPFGSVDILVDSIGGFTDVSGGDPELRPVSQQGRLFPIRPFRSFDSRDESPFESPGSLTPGSVLIIGNQQGWTDIINLTAVRPTEDGFLSIIPWRDGSNDEPITTSTVNFRAGSTVANAGFATGAPRNGIFNPFGRTHVIIDRFGYLTPVRLQPADEIWAR